MIKYLTVLASFIIMLCLGSVYAWSIIASELIDNYNFTAAQSQIIFGTLIGTFPTTMIFVGRIGRKIEFKYLGYIAGILFFVGYFIASISNGSFVTILTGIGVFGGISTGFGYWVALTSPVQWFPERKGFITGIAAAGFGLGAVFMSEITNILLSHGKDILQILKIFGVAYGIIIVSFSNLIVKSQNFPNSIDIPFSIQSLTNSKIFRKLILGIFLGTFAGLLVIGSLKMIGAQNNISNYYLMLGIVFFAIANFMGRLAWGFLSDKIGANLGILIALLSQSISISALYVFNLSQNSFLIIASLIGFCFGGNFVLFAKETAQVFGVNNFGMIYPYVFLGYAIAGIAGPLSGGLLFDYTGSFLLSIILASGMSLVGSLLFIKRTS